MGQVFEMDKKGLKKGFWAENIRFSSRKERKTCRVREGGKRKIKNQNFSLQSMEFRWSEFVGPRTKVHLLDEGYVWVPKIRDFAEDSSEEFGKSKVSGLRSVNGTS